MHSDSWGQYGPETDNSPIYYKFIENMQEMDISMFTSVYEQNPIIGDISINTDTTLNTIIKCPLCRMDNDKSEIKKIKGLSEVCSICYDNNVEIYFSNCEHACVCNDCFEKLN